MALRLPFRGVCKPWDGEVRYVNLREQIQRAPRFGENREPVVLCRMSELDSLRLRQTRCQLPTHDE